MIALRILSEEDKILTLSEIRFLLIGGT
jgi:hypothetical protein